MPTDKITTTLVLGWSVSDPTYLVFLNLKQLDQRTYAKQQVYIIHGLEVCAQKGGQGLPDKILSLMTGDCVIIPRHICGLHTYALFSGPAPEFVSGIYNRVMEYAGYKLP